MQDGIGRKEIFKIFQKSGKENKKKSPRKEKYKSIFFQITGLYI